MAYPFRVHLTRSMSIAMQKTLSEKEWTGVVLYSELNANEYRQGQGQYLAQTLLRRKIEDVPDRGEVLKEQQETLFVDEKERKKFVATLREHHYATTLIIERSEYE